MEIVRFRIRCSPETVFPLSRVVYPFGLLAEDLVSRELDWTGEREGWQETLQRERENVYIFGGDEEMGRPSEKDSAPPENKAK